MKQHADLFKVLGDENRLKIIKLLTRGDTCSCQIVEELTISQPTLSYHLKLLRDAKLISSKKDGNRVNHTVNKELMTNLCTFISQLTECTSCTV